MTALAVARALYRVDQPDAPTPTRATARLVMRCANALAMFRRGAPRRYVLAVLIAEVEDTPGVGEAERRRALIDVAAAVYPCP